MSMYYYYTGEALSGKMHRKANYENFEEYFKSLSDEIKGHNYNFITVSL